MPKFFQVEKAAYSGAKNTFTNVKFKKNALDNSAAAEAGTALEIIPLHIKNPPVIQFISYLTSIKETFKSAATATQPFGRTDPYYMWKSNDRTITVGFDIPSSSVTKGLDNLNNLSWFLAALYPTYKDNLTTTSIAASPMFRVRFANLICSSTNDGQGLPGVIQSVSVTHDHKQGFINVDTNNMGTSFASAGAAALKNAGFEDSISEGKKLLIPKLMKISFNLNVVHDHQLGWNYHTGEWRGGPAGPRFPYDFGLVRGGDGSTTPGTTLANEAAGNLDVDLIVPGSPAANKMNESLDDLNNTPGVNTQTGDSLKTESAKKKGD